MPIIRYYVIIYKNTNLGFLQNGHKTYFTYDEAKSGYEDFKTRLFYGEKIELVKDVQGEAPRTLESYTKESE